MSHAASNWVWERSRATGTTRLVMLAIADQADDEGGNAWPSVDRLARRCQVKERAVQKAIADAVALGELRVERQAGGPAELRPDRRPNRFTILMSGVHESTPRPGDGAHEKVGRGARENADGVHERAPKASNATVLEPSENELPRAARARETVPSRGVFALFWQTYPRKVGRLDAERVWTRRVKAGTDPHELLEAVRTYAAWVAAGGVESPRFVPHPATWLQQGRETDELPDPATLNGTARASPVRESYGAATMANLIERDQEGRDAGEGRGTDPRDALRRLPPDPSRRLG